MRLAVAVAAAAAALLAACGPSKQSPSTAPPTGLGPGSSCTATAQCRTDLACTSGKCGTLAAAASCPSLPGSAALHVGTVYDPGDPGPTACVSTVRSPVFSSSDIVVQDLSEHQVGDTVTFSMAAGTSSFTIVSQEVNGSAVGTIVWNGTLLPNTVVPDQVRTPANAVYYDDLTGTSTDALYLGATPVSGAFTAPNTSAGLDTVRMAGQITPGTWSFQANDWARECLSVPGCTGGSTSGRYHLHAVTKTAPVTSTGTLDVEVYLLTDPSSVISTASAAAADSQVQRWVASLGYFLGNAGVCLGDVTFHDLPAWISQRFPNGSVNITGDGPCDPLQQLFTTALAPRRAVHLFLVEELILDTQQAGGNIVVGVDGSIPGPSGFPGTIVGGAAVGLFGDFGTGSCSTPGAPSLGTCGTDRIAYIAAHEVGHWLGLSHTTESTGDFFDPLTDTGECPCDSCGGRTCPNSAGLTAAQCTVSATCAGGDNLMFWLLQPPYSMGALSRDQGQVVRLNTAVR